MKALSATTSTDALRVLLARAIRFAGNDQAVPVLRTVRLFEHDGVLHAVATDRYRILVRRTDRDSEAEQVEGGFDLLVSTSDAKTLIKTLGSHKKGIATILAGDKPRVVIRPVDVSEDQEINLAVQDFEYPNVLKLFKFKLAAEQDVILNSKFIADTLLDGAKRPTTLFAFTQRSKNKSGKKAAVLFSADEFEIGLLMPIQEYGDNYGSRLDKLMTTWSWLKN